MLAILAPGQGAQSAGFLRPWLDLPAYTDHLQGLVAAAGVEELEELVAGYANLRAAEERSRLRQTRLLQPLLVSVGVAAAALLPESVHGADVLAGHSVGELTTMTLAGVVEPATGLRLAAARGAAMAAAAALRPTAMAAVVAADPAVVELVVEAGASRGLTAANRNLATQVVLAGPSEAVTELEAGPPPGARVVRLEVNGAFHSEHMRPAVAPFRAAIGDLVARDPSPPVVSNLDGALLRSGTEVLSRLPAQLLECVRWDLCQRTLLDQGVTGVLELPPAATLSALARHAMPGVERFALSSPEELQAARRFAERHAG